MPIRINLLAEGQAAEEMRRKDPVKRGIWVGVLMVSIVVAWIVDLQMKVTIQKRQFDTQNTIWTATAPKFAAVTNNQLRIVMIARKLAQLDRLSTNRFLWAPALDALQRTVTDNIEVVRIHGDQSYTKEEPRSTGDATKKPPTVMVERIVLTIDAKDFNSAEQDYNRYKEALNNSPYFLKHVGRKDSFVIDGVLSPLTADPTDPNRQFVTFTLASRFPEARRSE